MLTLIRGLILLIHFLPFVLFAQSQKVGIDQEHIVTEPSLASFLLKPIEQNIDYSPDHSFYLAKVQSDQVRPSFPGKLLRRLDHNLAIVALFEHPKKDAGGLSLLAPVNDYWKLSPLLMRQLLEGQSGTVRFVLQLENISLFKDLLRSKNISLTIIKEEYPALNSLSIETSFRLLFTDLLTSPLIHFVDVRNTNPLEERAVRGLDLSVNKVNVIHHRYPDLNGANTRVSIKENSFDSTDIDLRTRRIASALENKNVSTHSTTMTTMIGGAGNSFYSGKGVAWGTYFSASSFANLLPDPISYFEAGEIWVQNHSYGVGIENYYGLETMAYDEQVYDNAYLLHVFSAGNNGDATSEEGIYQGIPGVANLTGNMKMAKNLLTVGSIDTTLYVSSLSSRGPAFDGRVKPEIVAFGEDGSSGAAAITSGAVLLLQQAYEQQIGVILPAGLVRAVLLNSADDLGSPGPNIDSGYGNLNTLRAIETIKEERFFKGVLMAGEEEVFELQLPENAINLKVTLAWIDPPALVNTDKALVNDLDLSVTNIESNESWLPWTLNDFPHIDSLHQAATRKTDRLNNQEQITVATPNDRNYSLLVHAFDVVEEPQTFYLAYEWDIQDRFDWVFPQAADPVLAGNQVALRWENPSGGMGHLSYRLVGENEDWQVIDPALALSPSYSYWEVPDSFTLAQLKMTTVAGDFITDTFTISKPGTLRLALDCQDQMLLNWDRVNSVDRYQLYGMSGAYLAPLMIVEDTFVVLEKAQYPSPEFAIAPISTAGFEGLRSEALNLEFQSVGCYVNSFLADLIDDRVRMQLLLGSLYEVEEVTFEKQINGQFLTLNSFTPANRLQFEGEDLDLREGSNIYRAAIRLVDGTLIYSDVISLLYTNQTYFVFPNPTSRALGVGVISKALNDVDFLLFDNLGRLHLSIELQSTYEEIPIDKLAPGVYHYQVRSGTERVSQGRLIIQ